MDCSVGVAYNAKIAGWWISVYTLYSIMKYQLSSSQCVFHVQCCTSSAIDVNGIMLLHVVLVRIKQSPFIAELNGVSVVAVAAVKNTFRYKHCIYSRSQFSDT